jgi:hypothetical protein
VWFRVLAAATPVVACGLIICSASGLLMMQPRPQTEITATLAQQATQFAQATAERAEREQQAAQTATAARGTQLAGAAASRTAEAGGRLLNLTEQALTQAAVPTVTVRPSSTQAIVATGGPASPTATPTPGIVTLTLLECRGYDGTVVFDGGGGQSLHAFGSLAFTVRGGVHHLQIFWQNHPDNNVDNQLNLLQDTTLVYGDQC